MVLIFTFQLLHYIMSNGVDLDGYSSVDRKIYFVFAVCGKKKDFLPSKLGL